jgi:nucleotide-binding universal stress UspA family protein
MRVLVWVTDDGWAACVDAALTIAPDDAELALLHVQPPDVAGVAHGAFSGLLGRGRADPDPGDRLESLATESQATLLAAAADRVGRPVTVDRRNGRVEREVVAAAAGFDLLVVSRDGDRSRLGPKSLGPPTRFVVDHAPCPVLLIWPEPAPGLDSIPAPKHGQKHRPGEHPPKHEPGHRPKHPPR